MIVNPNILDIGFTISPALSGKTFWDINVDGKLVFPSFGEWTITPNDDITLDVKMWGAGGAGGTFRSVTNIISTSYPRYQTTGGAGGFSRGTITFRKNVSYVIRVGQGGNRTTTATSGATYLAGGNQNTGNGGTNGGGYSGIFKSSVTQGNALLMAGGGGGGGPGGLADPSFSGRGQNNYGGPGGGLSGIDANGAEGLGGTGGTQIAGGTAAGGGGSTNGSALTGGLGGTGIYLGYAGGGGYFGGGGAWNFVGGGGGSGRVGTDSDILNGFTLATTPPTYADNSLQYIYTVVPPFHLDPDNGRAGIGGWLPFNAGNGNDGRIVMQYFPNIANTFSISPTVNGKSVWNLATDGDLNLGVVGEYTITPYSDITVLVKMWGAGGARGYNYTQGITSTSQQGDAGSGGYTTGTVVLRRGATYILRVGEGGARTIVVNDGARFHKGGVGSVFGGTEGGGYSGLFKNYTTQAGALLIAGGGGAGGDTSWNGGNIGGGGGSNGQNSGTSNQGGWGGSPTAGGAAAGFNGPSAGSALRGGQGQTTQATHASLGGGGGGYFGGGGGNVGGGGGGSGFVSTDPDVTSASTTTASGNTPANSADSDRGGAGQGGNATIGNTGSDGRILIRL